MSQRQFRIILTVGSYLTVLAFYYGLLGWLGVAVFAGICLVTVGAVWTVKRIAEVDYRLGERDRQRKERT